MGPLSEIGVEAGLYDEHCCAGHIVARLGRSYFGKLEAARDQKLL